MKTDRIRILKHEAVGDCGPSRSATLLTGPACISIGMTSRAPA